MNNIEKAELATLIATTVAQTLAAMGLTQNPAQMSKVETGPVKKQAQLTSETHPETGFLSDDMLVLTVSKTAGDKRIKLPASMVTRHGWVNVNGEKLYAVDSDQGRAKFQPSSINAERGDTVIFMRQKPGYWTAIVDDVAEIEVKPQAQRQRIELAPVSTSRNAKRKIQPEVEETKPVYAKYEGPKSFKTLAQIVKYFAPLAIEGQENGHYNEKIVDMSVQAGVSVDPRGFLQTANHKAFKNALKDLNVKLPQGIAALAREMSA